LWIVGFNAVQEFLARNRQGVLPAGYGRLFMLKDRTFTYRGHTFQVRATLLEKGWAVQVYEHGKPISPPYKITHETAVDYSTAGWGRAVEALMHTAQNDVEEEHLPEVKRLFHPK
jgi:hypothetical protein